MPGAESKQNREFARVDAYVPIEVRRVAAGTTVHSRSCRESIVTEAPPLPQVDDRVLAECLQILSAKLDSIISLLTLRQDARSALEYAPINISGGGLNIALKEAFSPGESVEIRMVLPNSPFCMLYVYADVIRVEPGTNGDYATSLRFTEIDTDIREKITKFVFERQRELLRKQKEQ